MVVMVDGAQGARYTSGGCSAYRYMLFRSQTVYGRPVSACCTVSQRSFLRRCRLARRRQMIRDVS
ncbi:hypothetical protein KCP77_06700 [Salmonella enterica subsp. enterica]|nr:hypothetical protein KCP77_06700 [Salmonella enterica subsp. enterica]